MFSTSARNALPEAIATQRLRLVVPTLAMVPAMARFANNRAIYEMLARLPHPYDETHARQFVETIARGPTTHAYAIVSGSGEYIGVISLMQFEPGAPELGYWLGQPFWGHGYASEAAFALVAATRATGAFSGLTAKALVDNSASCRVLEKAGLARTGEAIADCGPHQNRLIAHFSVDFGKDQTQ